MSNSEKNVNGTKVDVTISGVNLNFTATISITHKGDPLELTNASSGGWQEFFEGESATKGVAVSGTAYLSNNVASVAISEAFESKSFLALTITFDDTNKTISGNFIVSSLGDEVPVNGVVSMSFALESSGQGNKTGVS